MVVFTDFLQASAQGYRESGSGAALERTDERDGWYYAFHARALDESKDNLAINTWCHPVFATQLSVLKEAARQQEKRMLERRARARATKKNMPPKKKRGRPPKYASPRTGSEKQTPTAGGLETPHAFPSASNASPEKEKIVYVSRSGRQTTKTSYRDLLNVDDDGIEDDGEARTKRRRRGNFYGNGGSMQDKAGVYEYWDDFSVFPNGQPLAHLLTLDSSGTVTALDAQALAGLKEAHGVGAIMVGDKIRYFPADGNSCEVSAWINNCTELKFRRVHSKNFQKLTSLCGDLIHPTKLYEEVAKLGGYENVVKTRVWQTIRLRLGLKQTTSSGASLRKAYEMYFMVSQPTNENGKGKVLGPHIW